MFKAQAGLLALTVCLPPILVTQSAYSQEVIDEIIVSGSKSDTKLKDLPSSATVLTDSFIEQAHITKLGDIESYVPNLRISQLSEVGSRYIGIRGIASNALIENRVAVYIDGVPYRSINDQLLVDVAQIEVLRGPQGALYGANTEGGVVIVKSAPTDGDASFKVRGNSEVFGNGFQQSVLASAKGAITDSLSGRFAVNGRFGDAFSQNIDPANGHKGSFKSIGLLATLNYQPSDRFEASVQFSGEFFRSDGMATESYVPINIDLYNELYADTYNQGRRVGKYEFSSDVDRYFDEDEYVVSLNMAYEFDGARLLSISSYRSKEEDVIGIEADFTSAPIFSSGGIDKTSEWYQELRLVSAPDSPFEWVIGSSFMDSQRDLSVKTMNILGGQTEFSSMPPQEEGGEDLSFFGNIRVPFAEDKAGFSFGGRYEVSKRSVDTAEQMISITGFGDFLIPAVSDDRTFKRFLPKVSLDYQVTENTKLYVSAASGWQPGGFNVDAFNTNLIGDFRRYDAEKIWTYELGAKGETSDRRLTWSAAVYLSKADNWQEFNFVLDANGQAQSTSVITSAAELESKGFEFEANWLVNQNFSMSGSFGYTDVEYDSFEFSSTQDFSGNKGILTPKYTANLIASYEADNGWFVRGEAAAVGNMYLNPENTVKQDAYVLLGGSIGWQNDQYSISLYGKNLTGKYYFVGQGYTNFIFGYDGTSYAPVGTPRRIGLALSARW